MKKVIHLTRANKRYDQRICFLQEHDYDVMFIVSDDLE